MDREAAKAALGGFFNGKTWSANQIEFVNLIVNHLTEHGSMEAAGLYESPFTDVTPHGPDGLLSASQVDALLAALEAVRATAVAACLATPVTHATEQLAALQGFAERFLWPRGS